jgi:putative transposase
MRLPRITAEGAGFYHCFSRIIDRRFILQSLEKEYFYALMRKVEIFTGVQILTFCVVDNHFHLLLHVPEKQAISDDTLLLRIAQFESGTVVQNIAQHLRDARERDDLAACQAIHNRYLPRMHDLSAFMKLLKQRFSIWYNHQVNRKGTLWEERFKSILVENAPMALLSMAVYIDLNPVRAGLTRNPKLYRYCGLGAAMGGQAAARAGLTALMLFAGGGGTWRQIVGQYRAIMAGALRRRGAHSKRGMAWIQEALEQMGMVSFGELLLCRVRYFTDGVVLGGQSFVENIFQRYRRYMGARRKDGSRPMRGGEWGGLCTLRDLRRQVITPPAPLTP